MATVKKMVEKKTVEKKVGKKVVVASETPKTTVKKAVAKTATVKKAVARKAETKVDAAAPAPVDASREDRFRQIETEAFLLAEKDNFKADPLCYWIAAEKKVLQAAG